MKWYQKVLLILALILLIPFVPLVVVLIFSIVVFFVLIKPFLSRKERKAYKKSSYYKDLQVPYRNNITYKVCYRAYTAFRDKGVDIQYIRQKSNNY